MMKFKIIMFKKIGNDCKVWMTHTRENHKTKKMIMCKLDNVKKYNPGKNEADVPKKGNDEFSVWQSRLMVVENSNCLDYKLITVRVNTVYFFVTLKKYSFYYYTLGN